MRSSRLFSLVLCLSGLGALAGCDDGSDDPDVIGTGGVPGETGGSTTGGTGTGGEIAATGGTGTGGEIAATGGTGTGGEIAATGGAATGGTQSGPPSFGTPVYDSSGTTQLQYHKTNVKRNDLFYYFMTNGWGDRFGSSTISWNGTSFTIDSYTTTTNGSAYEPAGYPAMFCGVYSDSVSRECGLPKAVAEINNLYTGWRWNPNGNTGDASQYNAAYDIWVGSGTTIDTHNGFLMVWLHDPSQQRPAGALMASGVTVQNVPGTWDVWSGSVGGKPCVSYIRPNGADSLELEFDVMDFWRDMPTRPLTPQINATHILSVAVGFEIWSGPLTNLESQDFYVDVR